METTSVEVLIRKARQLKTNFIDPDFPPLEHSLYPFELIEVGGPFDTKI
jgi:hypothetical protein